MGDGWPVPKDLIDGLRSVRDQRLVVTAWVLSAGARDDLRALRQAGKLWPAGALTRPARLSVLTVLLELEELGVCAVVSTVGGYARVTRRAEETAA